MSTVLRISQIKLKPDQPEDMLDAAVRHLLMLPKNCNVRWSISKKSLDARRKPDIFYVYSVDVAEVIIGGKSVSLNDVLKGKFMAGKHKNTIKNAAITQIHEYCFPRAEIAVNAGKFKRPVIAGFGPSGMFAALMLAQAGLCPIVIERGESVEERKKTVEKFWSTGELNTESNVQFGEGGAGTFSDGKLNTMIKDTSGRIKEMLKIFVEFGADSSVLYMNKPHIGTDVLTGIVSGIRSRIIELGGEVRFNSRITELITENRGKTKRLSGVKIENVKSRESYELSCDCLCLSIGHSARDTFEMLAESGCSMSAKSFAVGLRLEHPQSFIDYNAYGDTIYKMPAADYKVTYQTSGGRGVYSFCMCPGGYVVNASSERERIAVNGMSYSGRSGKNANSAIIVTVTPEDYGGDTPLSGMEFQRRLESMAYRSGNGNIPVQLLGDFKLNRVSEGFGAVSPCIRGSFSFANLREVLGNNLSEAISEGVTGFANYIKGFDMADAVFSGVESRTSSPVRIWRDENCESDIKGLYPCGEGAGYAGGITSAAVDGMKVAEKIALNFYGK